MAFISVFSRNFCCDVILIVCFGLAVERSCGNSFSNEVQVASGIRIVSFNQFDSILDFFVRLNRKLSLYFMKINFFEENFRKFCQCFILSFITNHDTHSKFSSKHKTITLSKNNAPHSHKFPRISTFTFITLSC